MTSSSRLWELWESWTGGWAGVQDFQGVWEGPGVAGWRPGAFHTPAASIAGVGTLGWVGAPGAAARRPVRRLTSYDDGCSTAKISSLALADRHVRTLRWRVRS